VKSFSFLEEVVFKFRIKLIILIPVLNVDVFFPFPMQMFPAINQSTEIQKKVVTIFFPSFEGKEDRIFLKFLICCLVNQRQKSINQA
jgi:hypothetical protein